ncbi:MAG: calcium/sodium antiporter [Odoribacter sp.]|nr:calcium/sodium antiporter [Odoribacter sp.]
MILNIVFVIVGIVSLIYGADKLVDGGAALAHRFNISNIVIGLTIVAFGTSAPELVVSAIASAQGQSEIAVGNVLGSNIFNILCILGITAIILPLNIKSNTRRFELPFTLFSAILLLFMFGNTYRSTPGMYSISRIEGIVLLIFFLIFIIYTFRIAKISQCEEVNIKALTLPKSIFFVGLGLVLLIAGGELLVKGAVKIAVALSISQRIIAITIVSVGTSLPELVTSIIAARKNNVDMAVGNIVGSNLFNTFLILGTAAVIQPIKMSMDNLIDISVNLLATIFLLIFVYVGRKSRISRGEGIILLVFFVGYMTSLIIKG